MRIDTMRNDELLAMAWQVAGVLPSVAPSAEVDEFVRARRRAFSAIAPDPKLAELRGRLESERAGLDAKIEAHERAVGEAALGAELDGADPKAAGALQRELAALREARDSIGHRLAALDARIRAESERVSRERREKAEAIAAELADERKRRRAEAVERLREAFVWLATLNADDNRLGAGAHDWSRTVVELGTEGKGGAA